MQKLVRRLITLMLAVTVAWLSTQLWFDFRSPAIDSAPTTVSVPRGSNLQPIGPNTATEGSQATLPSLEDSTAASSESALTSAATDQINRLEQQIKDLGVQLSQSEALVTKLKSEEFSDFVQVEWRSKGTLEFLTEFGYVPAPLLRKIGYFEVQAKINGQNAYFLLDTGAAQSLIGSDQADKFQITIDDLAQAREYVGLGGKAQASKVAIVDTFEIETVRLSGFSLSLVDLSYINQILEQAGQYPVHGLIGDDFLETHDAIIDFKNEVLYLKGI